MVLPRHRRTTSGWCAIGFHAFAFLLIAIAMFTANWLEAESKAYGTEMDRIGLWTQCFRSFTVNEDVHRETFFVGCRWLFNPFTTGYENVRSMMQTPAFVTVQVFFTICFTLSLVATALAGGLVLCPGGSAEVKVLLISSLDLFVAFFFGFIAVLVFGLAGPDPDWMPHWDHNNLSWSFALGVIGVVAEFVSAVLFWTEFRIQQRKELYRKGPQEAVQ